MPEQKDETQRMGTYQMYYQIWLLAETGIIILMESFRKTKEEFGMKRTLTILRDIGMIHGYFIRLTA